MIAAGAVVLAVLDDDWLCVGGAVELPGRPLDVLEELELALELVLVHLDLLEGHVDDGHHHVDQHHVDHDGEDEEDDGGQHVGVLDGPEVELADAHGDDVHDGAGDVAEVLQVRPQHVEEEGTEGHEDDAELHGEAGQPDEAEPDGR